MQTFLEISGENLVAKKLLNGLSIRKHSKIWQKGNALFTGSNNIHEQSGIQIIICDKNTFKQQLSETRRFLKKYKNEIIQLRSNSSVELALIRFGVNWIEGRDIAKFSYFPSEFLLLCGELRIDVKLCEYLTSK